MKLPDFAYHRPDTVAGALELLADLGDDAKVLAGRHVFQCAFCASGFMMTVDTLLAENPGPPPTR